MAVALGIAITDESAVVGMGLKHTPRVSASGRSPEGAYSGGVSSRNIPDRKEGGVYGARLRQLRFDVEERWLGRTSPERGATRWSGGNSPSITLGHFSMDRMPRTLLEKAGEIALLIERLAPVNHWRVLARGVRT
jgi:hypothetical protein